MQLSFTTGHELNGMFGDLTLWVTTDQGLSDTSGVSNKSFGDVDCFGVGTLSGVAVQEKCLPFRRIFGEAVVI